MDAQRAFVSSTLRYVPRVLFGSASVAALLGVLSPAAARVVFGSAWYASLLALLAFVAFALGAVRFPWRRHRGGDGLRVWSAFFFHIFLGLSAAAGLLANERYSARDFVLTEGGSALVAGESAVLRSVRIESGTRDASGVWVSVIERAGLRQELQGTKAARFGDTALIQTDAWRTYTVAYRTSPKAPLRLVGVAPGDRIPLGGDERLSVSVERSEKSGKAARMIVWEASRAQRRLDAPEGQMVSIGGGGATVTILRSTGTGSFVERRAPGLGLVLGTLGLLALSACGLAAGSRGAPRTRLVPKPVALPLGGDGLGSRRPKGGAA